MKKWLVGIGIFVAVLVAFIVWRSTRCEVCEAVNYPPDGSIIVAFGDSLVEGVGSDRGGGFVTILSERLGVEVINLGVSGNTTEQGRARLGEALELQPDIAIIVLGGNDVIKKLPQEETFANLEFMITELQQQGSVVIIAGVRTGIFSKRYNDEYEALAKRTGALYLEDILDGLFGKAEFMADPIHPNDVGYARIADRFEALLTLLLPGA